MYVNMSVRMLVRLYVHNINLPTIQIVWKLNVGVFKSNSGLKCNKIQFWTKILDLRNFFLIPLVNRPENRFLGGNIFLTLKH